MLFWSLTKPARTGGSGGGGRDPLAKLERGWERYVEQLEAALGGEHKEKALQAVARHGRVMRNLFDEAGGAAAGARE